MHRAARLILFASVSSCLTLDAPAQGASPVNVTLHNREMAFAGLNTEILGIKAGGYIANSRFRVFDMNGVVLREWVPPIAGWFFDSLVKPLPGGRIVGFLSDISTGYRVLVEIDWDGVLTWVFDPTVFGVRVHHDFERLPNGNTLLLTHLARSVPWLRPGLTVDDILIEVDPSGNLVWGWSTLDSATTLPFTPAEWTYFSTLPVSTLFHTNSVQALPPNRWEKTDPRFRTGNLLVCQRDTNLVFLVDKPTRRVVWSYRGAIGQHHARMIPRNLPGAGNILIFDNGGSAGIPPVYRSHSRVVEIDPISYREVWSYSCISSTGCSASGTSTFFSPYVSGAQRLPNGNTLITEGTTGRMFEVTRAGTLVWEYRIASTELRIYRGYRFDSEWRRQEVSRFPW